MGLESLPGWLTDSLLLKTAIAALWLGLVGGLAWVLHRQPWIESEITRKVVHIGTGNVILIAWALGIPAWVGIGASVGFGAIALASYVLPLLPGIESVGRRSWGTFFYALSIGVLVAWFWPLHLPHYAALGILTMTWGDGLAGLIGKYWGRHPYQLWGMRKSWEGSLTMALVSGLVVVLVLGTKLGWGWPLGAIALSGAIVATALEAFSKLGIDNLTVPVGVAAWCFWLSQVLTP